MTSNALKNGPFLKITEQPGASYYRNESEMKKEKHGCIQGNSNGKTYPTVKVINAKDEMKLVVTPRNAKNGKLHYCRLVRKDRKFLSEKNMDPCSFVLTKNNKYTEILKLAIMIPEKNSSYLRPSTKKNLGNMVLKFELFDKNENKVHEIESQEFCNKRNKLEIKKLSQTEGNVEGSSNIWMACSRIQSKNNKIQVRFSRETWETYGNINDTPNQGLLIIDSPAYFDQNIVEPVTVDVQLKNQIDGTLSEKFQFTYKPCQKAINMSELSKKDCTSVYIDDNLNKEIYESSAINSNVDIVNEFFEVNGKRIENTTQTISYLNYLSSFEYNGTSTLINSETINSDAYSEDTDYNYDDFMVKSLENIVENKTKDEYSSDLEQILQNDEFHKNWMFDLNKSYRNVSENDLLTQNCLQDGYPDFQTESILLENL